MSQTIRPGVEFLSDEPGGGDPVERQRGYQLRLRMWLSRGDPVLWSEPFGLVDRARLEEDGAVLVTDLRVDRESMFAGLFYGIQGLRIGGRRRLRVAPPGEPRRAFALSDPSSVWAGRYPLPDAHGAPQQTAG